MKHKHSCVVLVKSTRMDGANTISIMFGTDAWCCDEF